VDCDALRGMMMLIVPSALKRWQDRQAFRDYRSDSRSRTCPRAIGEFHRARQLRADYIRTF